MERNTTFTEGKILQPLILFAMPVLFALFLQAMYGAVDLLVVGKFASSADVSAVSTGSQIMMTLTNLISSFAMGTTVLLGQLIGCGKKEEGGKAVGTAMVMFAGIALVMTVLLVCFAPQISSIMHAPKEAFYSCDCLCLQYRRGSGAVCRFSYGNCRSGLCYCFCTGSQSGRVFWIYQKETAALCV